MKSLLLLAIYKVIANTSTVLPNKNMFYLNFNQIGLEIGDRGILTQIIL